MIHFQDKVSFIWSIAEILRGPYKPEDYGKVVLPLAVLRRFDCVLESTKEEVLTSSEKFKHLNEDAREPILNRVNAVNFYKKMKKSLGNKRNEITDEQIEEIVRLYGDFKKGEYVKIFDNEDFGYQKITVERPLRLNFKIDEERIARVTEQKAFQNLATSKKKGENGLAEIEKGKQTQAKIIEVLQSLASEEVYKNREDITKMLKEVFKQAGLTINTPVLKGILAGLSEKDETADICMKNKTEPEPDPDLRDTENVPLRENIYTY